MRRAAMLAQLRSWRWGVDENRRAFRAMLGPGDPLPDAACWGAPEHPANSPLWVWIQPESIGRCCERIWRVRPQDSLMLLGTENNTQTWETLWNVASRMPHSAAIWVVSVDDLRRARARRVTRNPRYR